MSSAGSSFPSALPARKSFLMPSPHRRWSSPVPPCPRAAPQCHIPAGFRLCDSSRCSPWGSEGRQGRSLGLCSSLPQPSGSFGNVPTFSLRPCGVSSCSHICLCSSGWSPDPFLQAFGRLIFSWKKKKRRDHLVSFSWLGIKGKNCYLKVQKREHELQVNTRQLKWNTSA